MFIYSEKENKKPRKSNKILVLLLITGDFLFHNQTQEHISVKAKIIILFEKINIWCCNSRRQFESKQFKCVACDYFTDVLINILKTFNHKLNTVDIG